MVESIEINGTIVKFYDDYIEDTEDKFAYKTLESVITEVINKSLQL